MVDSDTTNVCLNREPIADQPRCRVLQSQMLRYTCPFIILRFAFTIGCHIKMLEPTPQTIYNWILFYFSQQRTKTPKTLHLFTRIQAPCEVGFRLQKGNVINNSYSPQRASKETWWCQFTLSPWAVHTEIQKDPCQLLSLCVKFWQLPLQPLRTECCRKDL